MTMSDNRQGNGGVPFGDIQFYKAITPPLLDGDYTLVAAQTLSGLPGAQPSPPIPPVSLTFSVRGPRFRINPADIHSVYPPSGNPIPYEGQIPHLVVSRKTLPWERLLAKNEDRSTPWIALLTVYEDDPAGIPKVVSGTVGDLIAINNGGKRPATTGGTAMAQTDLDDGESLADPCSYIDLPACLFTAIAPRVGELPFLAHARGVHTGNKPIEGIIEDGIYSVVISNRLSHNSSLNGAFLVSLEYFTDLLTGTIPTDVDTVRLAVLYSWLFQMGNEDPFDILMSPGHSGLLSINSPPNVTEQKTGTKCTWRSNTVSPPTPNSSSFAADTVNYALQSGYAALSHELREGDQIFSWYRGPLIPYQIGLVLNGQSNPVFRCADELLRYNPESGLFDTTYAAAFQLGRLMALQSEAFLTSLRTYLHQVKGQAFRLANRTVLVESDRTPLELPETNQNLLRNGVVLDATINWLARNGIEALNSASLDPSGAAPQNIEVKNSSVATPRFSRLYQFLSDKTNSAKLNSAAAPPPDTVLRWLANLVLLTGVPFEYLVPDERMLPQESLRFFFLDENWIERLMDGALSIVGRTGLDQLITDSLRTVIKQPVADSVTTSVRQRLLGVHFSSAEKLNWPLTGFLIRSVVVDHWKGIVVENTSKLEPTKSLTTLRLDQPARGILLGLYNGELGSVTFKHPPESLHFGIDGQEDTPQTWVQKIRRLDTGIYDDQKSVQIKFHDQEHRVIDVIGTKDEIANAVDPKPDNFTSAELAIEMIESPKSVTFEMLWS